jgi:hypothetical protein
MKSVYKYLSVAAVSGALCLFLAIPAMAQHDHGGGGGGGGGSRPAPSSGGGGSSGRSSFSGASRPAAVAQPRANIQRSNNNYNNNNSNYSRQRTSSQNTQYSNRTSVRTGVARAGVINRSGLYGGGAHVTGTPYYHYNHGYYNSYYRPRLGFTIGVLPFGYYPFYFGDYQYFYDDGLYYEYNNDQYTVVEPPVGAEINSLPANAQSIVINGQQYYEADGVYYQPITKDDGTVAYQVAGEDGELNTGSGGTDTSTAPPPPQIGDIVQQLPANCRKININGDKLFLSPDGIYYKAQADANNNTVYSIVGLPADDSSTPNQ